MPSSPRGHGHTSAGFALIALLALITAGALFFLLEVMSPEAIDARRQRQDQDVLAQAREALIGYALVCTGVPAYLVRKWGMARR